MSSMDKEIKNSDTNSGNVDQEEEQIKTSACAHKCEGTEYI